MHLAHPPPRTQAADEQGTGHLPPSKVKSILKELSFKSLGLSTLQLVTLMSHAPTTPDGMVQYVQFVPVAASIVLSMYDVDGMKLRLQAIKEVADAGGVASLSELDLLALRGVLEQAFQKVDADETGQLTQPQVRRESARAGWGVGGVASCARMLIQDSCAARSCAAARRSCKCSQTWAP